MSLAQAFERRGNMRPRQQLSLVIVRRGRGYRLQAPPWRRHWPLRNL
jgi:hypothetical protein